MEIEPPLNDFTFDFIGTSYLKQAIKEAEKSTHQQQIGVCIFKGKRIISLAHNSVRSNHVPPSYKNYFESFHAETHAILKGTRKGKTNLKGCSILVVRLSINSKLLLAKPCKFCFDFIQFSGIKNIYYSDNNRILKLNQGEY